MDNIINYKGYLSYESTLQPVLWYECDPSKNVACDKRFCRYHLAVDDDTGEGFCSKTSIPEYRKDGGKAWYAVLKADPYGGEPYWGREYQEGV